LYNDLTSGVKMSGDLSGKMGHTWWEKGYILQPVRFSIKSRDVRACEHVISHGFP